MSNPLPIIHQDEYGVYVWKADSDTKLYKHYYTAFHDFNKEYFFHIPTGDVS